MLAVFAAFALFLQTGAAQSPQASAERALLDGRIQDATMQLQSILATAPNDAAAHLLLCRTYYAASQVDNAISQCEAALAAGGSSSSEAEDWMGRAYGMKAQSAGMVSGFSLARKVRNAFEHAVQLDPRNAASVDDLAEYYVSAPAIVGGGLDKATALADREMPLLPQSAHRTRALTAEKNGDYTAAEAEFRAAAAVANRPGAWFDLGHFLARRQQVEPALVALKNALDTDAAKDSVLVDIASVLTFLHREPAFAEQLLHAYLASGAKSDAAPAFNVHYQLAQLLAARGDKAGAAHEYEQALFLFPDFAAARSVLNSLNGQKG